MAGERAMRPFWVHQIAEYLIGLALVGQGVQDPQPLVPALAGTLVIVNAAVTRGPVGAFKWVARGTHRWLDVAVMALVAAGAAQPWIAVSSGGRLVMAVVLVPLAFLWFYTDWAERVRRRDRRTAAAGPTGETVGRAAGRAAGNAYGQARGALRRRRGG